MPESHLSADDLFDEAIRKPSGNDRAAFLNAACGDDVALRERVEKLLRAAENAGSFLESPVIASSATVYQPVTEQPGDMLGPYKLLQQIGDGGMGVVYMAEQTEPIERRVALKIIKPGMDSRQVIARFEAERQALAMMDHPNIARALDAGVTETGRPYFVMELVKGVPITEYCDDRHLTPRERLALFIPICQAVQHAHQKGIIHRDIKPSNVLVAHYDDRPVPKVIDFGVAKAIDHRLTERTMFTEIGQVLGTFEYMSPEQARLNQWEVDTRSDVYSLGVLLYELLSGETPFDRKRLRSAAFDELLKIIREEEPPRPSTRVSTSESLPTIAVNRHIEPQKLSALVRGELDWIVMKALEKDRTRRYETASKFADDVQHYLNNETVEACPPSAAYRFQKFARRNKPLIATMAAIAAALLVGTSLATWQAIEADIERDRAVAAEQAADHEATRASQEADRADAAAKKAIAEAARAERELARAGEVKRLISDMLNGAAPAMTLGADPTILVKILDDTAQRLDAGEVKDELVAAELHWTIGDVYEELGSHQEALNHLTQAVNAYRTLKPGHIDTANVISHLGNVYRRLTNYEEAEKQIAEALHLSREHDEKSILSAGIMGDLATTWWCQGKYQDAERMYLDSLDILNAHIQGEGKRKLQKNLFHNLASLYLDMGRYSEAKQRIDESLEAMADLPTEHPEKLTTLGNQALVLDKLGDVDGAERIQVEVLESYRKIVDESHPQRLAAKHNLANSYRARSERTGDAELAERAMGMYQEIIDVGDAASNSPDNAYAVINAKSNLALMLRREGKLAEAETLYKDVIDELNSNNDPVVHRYRLGLADVYSAMGRATDDQKLLSKAKKICQDVLALESGEKAIELQGETRIFAKTILVDIYESEGDQAAAMQMARGVIDEINGQGVLEQAERITNPMLLTMMERVAWMHHSKNECAEAARLYRQVLKGAQGNPKIPVEMRLATHANLGRVLLKMEKYDEARIEFEECLPQMRAELPPGHQFTENVIRWIAETYENLGEHDKARQHYAEALELQLGRFKEDDHAPTMQCLAEQLLTHQYEQLRDPKRGLDWARRACELARETDSEHLSKYLDTLALAQHQTGDTTAAIESEQEALDRLSEDQLPSTRKEYEKRIEQYKADGDAEAKKDAAQNRAANPQTDGAETTKDD